MLQLREQKILIFTPNKCGSTSIIEALTKQMDAEHILGPQGPYKALGHFNYSDSFGKHSCFTPAWCHSFKKYIILRDPFERMVSLWRHYVKYHGHDVPFDVFLGLVSGWSTNADYHKWFYYWKLSQFVEQAGAGTEIIWLNDLSKLSRVLDTPIAFPHLHETQHDNWQNYYTGTLYTQVTTLL